MSNISILNRQHVILDGNICFINISHLFPRVSINHYFFVCTNTMFDFNFSLCRK